MIIYKNSRKIQIEAHKLSELGKYSGLMFKSKETKNLLFNFREKKRHGIHSYFVFFPFLAIWLDEKNNILETKIVRPFTFLVKPKKPFSRLIEVPVNKENSSFLKKLVGENSKI